MSTETHFSTGGRRNRTIMTFELCEAVGGERENAVNCLSPWKRADLEAVLKWVVIDL